MKKKKRERILKLGKQKLVGAILEEKKNEWNRRLILIKAVCCIRIFKSVLIRIYTNTYWHQNSNKAKILNFFSFVKLNAVFFSIQKKKTRKKQRKEEKNLNERIARKKKKMKTQLCMYFLIET